MISYNQTLASDNKNVPTEVGNEDSPASKSGEQVLLWNERNTAVPVLHYISGQYKARTYSGRSDPRIRRACNLIGSILSSGKLLTDTELEQLLPTGSKRISLKAMRRFYAEHRNQCSLELSYGKWYLIPKVSR